MKYYSSFLESKDNRTNYKVSPITVLILILINTVAIFLKNINSYYIFLVISFTVLLLLNKRKFMKMLLIYLLILTFIKIYQININNRYVFSVIGQWFGGIYTMLLMIIRIYSILVLSRAMMSFDTSIIINVLRKLKLSNNLAISIAIFFRFLPDYFNYLSQINEGAKVRGIEPSLIRPIKTLETYIVPLIHKAFDTGDIITSSLITKGIEYDCDKTSYRNLKLNIMDGYIITFSLILLGVSIWKM